MIIINIFICYKYKYIYINIIQIESYFFLQNSFKYMEKKDLNFQLFWNYTFNILYIIILIVYFIILICISLFLINAKILFSIESKKLFCYIVIIEILSNINFLF